jgi:hypothetical protein
VKVKTPCSAVLNTPFKGLILLALLVTSSLQAMSLNRFVLPQLVYPLQSAYASKDNRLLYIMPVSETTTAVIGLNLTTMQSTTLLELPTNELVNFFHQFHELDGGLMFLTLQVDDEIDRLYVSRQGQPFELYFNRSLRYSPSFAVNDALFIHRMNDGTTFVTNGDPDTHHYITGSYDVVCAFDLNHFVLSDRNGIQKAVYEYLDGDIRPLIPNHHLSSLSIGGQPAVVDDACVFQVTHRFTEERSFYHHPKAGEPAFLAANVLWVKATSSDFITLNERTSAFIPRTLELLDGQTLEKLNVRQVGQQSNPTLIINNDRVFLYNETQHLADELLVLDSGLNPYSGPISVKPGNQLLSTPELDFLAYPDRIEVYQLGQLINTLSISSGVRWRFDYTRSQLVLHDVDWSWVVHPNTEYLKLDPKPAAGSAMQGPWIDTQYPNQGLSIQHGIRDNGTEYIYTTLYLFRDGAPFWLAGATDVVAGQAEVDIELFEFNGANFLDNQAPDQIPFGFMNLKFTTCDQMQATVSYGDSITSLDLRRVDDRSFQSRCFDVNGGGDE